MRITPACPAELLWEDLQGGRLGEWPVNAPSVILIPYVSRADFLSERTPGTPHMASQALSQCKLWPRSKGSAWKEALTLSGH